MISRGLLATIMTLAAAATVMLGGVVSAAATTPPDRQILEFAPDGDPDLRNPERGLFIGTSSLLDIAAGSGFLHQAAQVGTVAHLNVDLSAYYDAHPDDDVVPDTTIPQSILEQYGVGFQKLREAGMKAIMRFSYTPKGTTVCGEGVNPGQGGPRPDGLPDAGIDVILKHITQLSEVLTDNADVIASFEAGFLGEFGEWHCSINSADGIPKNGNPIVSADKTRVIEAEREYFPPRTIAMRYPADIAELSATTTLAGIGSHQDCYASSANDKGTWGADMQSEIETIGELGRTASVNATVCTSYPERVNCSTALDADQFGLAEMPTMHFSLLAADLNPAASTWMEPYRTGGCWDRIRASLGYRLVLHRAEVPSAIQPGSTARLRITLSNDGFAAMYNPRPVSVVLQGDGDPTVIPIPIDARSWQPGNVTIDQEIAIPSDIAPGTYGLGLWLPDPAQTLAVDPAFSVRFANENTWSAVSGVNVLGQVTVAGVTPSPSPPSPSPSSPSASPPAPQLAASGGAAASWASLLSAGAVIMVGGGALMLLRRRRSGRDDSEADPRSTQR